MVLQKCSGRKRIAQWFGKPGPHAFQACPSSPRLWKGKRPCQTVILHRHNILEGPQVICDPVGYFVPDADWHARAFKGGHGGDGIMTSRSEEHTSELQSQS